MKSENALRILPSDLSEWQKSVGVRRVQRVMVDADVIARFSAVTGAAAIDSKWPALGHWALFLDAVGCDGIGYDGHPLRGGFLPAVHLPRRMFAAADLQFDRDLEIGRYAQCTSTVASVTHKSGKTGDLVFVVVDRQITQDDAQCVREQQTIVYRQAGAPIAPIQTAEKTVFDGETWCPGPVELFRFSAVTFNSHRIHYDFPYAQVEEGYPDLVVQGPFTALKLLRLAARRCPRPIRRFSFRGVAPLFVSQRIELAASGISSVIARRCDGAIAMTADVEFFS